MTTTYSSTGTQTPAKAIHPSDIKAIIQRRGKITIGNQEFTLKDPIATDPNLQAIANDPALTVKPIKNANGQAEYELIAKEKSVKIKIDIKTIN